MKATPTTWLTFILLAWILKSGVVLAAIIIEVDVGVRKYDTISNISILSYEKRAVGNACGSLVSISNPGQFFFPQGYKYLQRPWVDNPTATSGTSAVVSQRMHSLLHLEVVGLDGETIENITQELQKYGYLSFPIGDSVRDQFLGESTTNTMDLESNCDSDEVYRVCLGKWGFSKCSHIGEGNIVRIGNIKTIQQDTNLQHSPNWNKTFFGNGTSLQYTTNSIAYFADVLNILIDITGYGVSDTCKKIIRIPVAADYWEQWMSPDKLFSFWKLRVMGYRAVDADTMSYIISNTIVLVTEMPEHFQNLYCTAVLNGQMKNSPCSIPQDLCSEAMSKKVEFNDVFEMDLDEFWSDRVKSLVDGLKCDSCSSFTRSNACSGGVENGTKFALLLIIVIGQIMFF